VTESEIQSSYKTPALKKAVSQKRPHALPCLTVLLQAVIQCVLFLSQPTVLLFTLAVRKLRTKFLACMEASLLSWWALLWAS
jgi:hypothetical protein